jgi:SAM-dependent methyltransferase
VTRPALQDGGESLGLDLTPGALHYRAYVGWPQNYDLVAAATFNVLTTIGLRQHHALLDIGCGSLRVGRVLIPYLNAGKYVGVEPNRWLVDDGIKHEVGDDLVRIKRPTFLFSDSPSVLAGVSGLDFALAQAVFSHCGVDLLESWMASISRALSANGVLVATFRRGDEDFAGSGWSYPEAVYHTPATMERIASAAGLTFQPFDWRDAVRTWAVFAKPGFDASWFAGKPLTWNAKIDSGRL